MMISEKIKLLRSESGMTQAELARKLSITRAGVNAWEMGVSVPSTQYIVELAMLFNVSADYLLGLSKTSTVSVEGLSEYQVKVVREVIECMRNKSEE